MAELNHLERGNPLWWVHQIEPRIRNRQPTLQKWLDYYNGVHPLEFMSDRFSQNFGNLFDGFADNWCPLPVDATAERMIPVGFRLGEDPAGDKDAWRLWQANYLDADVRQAHTEMLRSSEISMLVWPDPKNPDTPRITVEDPWEMLVVFEPGDRRRRRAAMKLFVEDDGTEVAYLYLPDGLYKFKALWGLDNGIEVKSEDSRWGQLEVEKEAWPLKNPMGDVPVVPIFNRPALRPVDGFYGISELRDVMPVQDGINKLVADMLVASEFGAFRQRWMTGVSIPKDPVTQQPIMPFKVAIERMLTGPKDAKFGDFQETNLEIFVKAIEMLIQHVASQTRTPPHYFYLRGEFPSGESIKSAETGLVAKVRGALAFAGEGYEEVIRLAFKAMGDKRGDITNSETIWGDPESRSEAEHTDAIIKLKALGVPDEILWEKAGFGPTEIARIKAVKAAEALEAAVFNVPEEEAEQGAA